MAFGGTACRILAGISMLAAGGLAAGCQSKDALNSAGTPEKPKVTESELRAFCPPVGLRQGTAFYTSYEKTAPARPAKKAAASPADAPAPEDTGLTDKPAQRVVYQTSITDVTRSCSRADGILTMKVGVAGKVVPGPAAKLGTVQLPLRIAITTGDQVLFSQLFQHSVEVQSTTTATQFVFTTDSVSFPDPNSRGVRGYAGFDEGPPAKNDSGTSDLPPS